MESPGIVKLIGHQPQRDALADLVNQDRLPSSLLFGGAAGIGKRLVALELARQLLCLTDGAGSIPPQGGCGECQACRLIRAGNHPDLRLIECGAEDASVDQLRATLDKLSLKPFISKRKVTILNDADEVSIVGANILLKSLEEPRPENFFILIATTSSRLPQTVLSRCQRWFFDRLSNESLHEILMARGAGAEELALIPLADGSCAELQSIRATGALGDDVRQALDAAWRGDIARITKTAQEWGADKNNIRQRLTLLRASIRERLVNSGTNSSAAAVWAHGLQNAIDAEYLSVDRHVNPTLTILEVLKSCNQGLAINYQITPNFRAPIWERIG
jgi:DNA polymerase-3 subunit delta'